MSVTLIYHKNGREIPIKMSIWDAFRGAPRVKAQLQKDKMKCPCCDKIHEPSSKTTDPKSSSNKNKPKDQKENDKNKHESNQQIEDEYTAEDDKKLINLKAQNKTWKEILDELGKKSSSQVKARWKEIQHKVADGDGKADKSGKSSDKETKKDDMKRNSKDHQTDRSTSRGKHENGKDHKMPGGWDSGLASFADTYDKRKWLAVASRHYDKTGQRISAEMAKKMVKEGTLKAK